MAAIVMDGNALRDEIVAGLAVRIEAAGSPEVCLATVLVGDDGPSQRYVNSKHKKAAEAGMVSRHHALGADATQDDVEAIVRELAEDPTVHGILVQLPLPDGLDPEPVLDLVPAEKDVDGLTERSMGRLVRHRPGLVSCTPLGVMRLLEKYEIPTSGKRAVVIGRSTLVGLPLSLLLNRKGADATVTMAHSRTADMADVVRGQYRKGSKTASYFDDAENPDSTTESFVALKTGIANWRWAGVPFYLRTGKQLAQGRAVHASY